jgi:hypothetical protein
MALKQRASAAAKTRALRGDAHAGIMRGSALASSKTTAARAVWRINARGMASLRRARGIGMAAKSHQRAKTWQYRQWRLAEISWRKWRNRLVSSQWRINGRKLKAA